MEVKTTGGAIVSVVAVLAMITLFFSELSLFLQTTIENHVVVDINASSDLIDVSLAVDFKQLTCTDLDLHVHDSKGRDMDSVTVSSDKTELPGGGCSFVSSVTLPRVAGQMHFSVGKANTNPNVHQHSMMLGQLAKYNASHTIKELRFGPELDTNKSPLKGVTKYQGANPVAFDYFLKLVPSEYHTLSGDMIWSHQYAVTEFERPAGVVGNHIVQPGLFFKWDFVPTKLVYKETRRSFVHFLSSCCAIIGGIFAVAGMANSTLYTTSTMMRKLK